jgi:hypothetical protein
MKRLALVFSSLLALAGASFAQNTGSEEAGQNKIFVGTVPIPSGALRHVTVLEGVQDRLPEGEIAFLSSEMMVSADIIKNAPYTASAVTERTQTLADGNRITNSSSVFMARDSQGRVRREDTLGEMEPLHVARTKMVLISDPVSHTDYFLLPDAQTVTVVKRDEGAELVAKNLRRKLEVVTKERRTIEAAAEHRLEKADVKFEDLGTQDIEGVACQGKRETVTIPAGQLGNERPIVISTEIWSSPDLHGIVLKKHTDPRVGETVYRLTNIKLGEPDASLFQVPSGYKITKPEPLSSKE